MTTKAYSRHEQTDGVHVQFTLGLCPLSLKGTDYCVLNRHLRKYTFRMLTHKVLCHSIRPGNWSTAINLSDAYFHIAVYSAYRKFLRFAHQGRPIPFRPSLAPRLFSKGVEAALSPRNSGIRIFSYIDDYVVCSHSLELAARDYAMVINHLKDLGFNINRAKSQVELHSFRGEVTILDTVLSPPLAGKSCNV